MVGYLAPLPGDAASQLAFRSAQCTLCHHLGAEYGLAYRWFAGPDLVFLALWQELLSGEAAVLGRQSCVMAPIVSRLPVRRTPRATRFAAAVGVYLLVKKLRDDWEDDRGWWRWALWRGMARGQRKVAATLESMGFSTGAMGSALAAQAQVERGTVRDLEAAAEPTRTIAELVFGYLPPGAPPSAAAPARELGRRSGGFLFWLDNTLDVQRDLAAGGYNALAVAHALGSDAPSAALDEAREGALEEADREIAAAILSLSDLPSHPLLAYMRQTVDLGFRDKLRRFRALPLATRSAADLRALLPPRAYVPDRLGPLLHRVRGQMPLQLRVALTAVLLYFLPRSPWTAMAWADTGGEELDTGDGTASSGG